MRNIYHRLNGGGIVAVLDRKITDWDLIMVGVIEAPDASPEEPHEVDATAYNLGVISGPQIDAADWRVCVHNGMLIPLLKDLIVYDPTTKLVKYTVHHPVQDGMIVGAMSAGEAFTFTDRLQGSILDFCTTGGDDETMVHRESPPITLSKRSADTIILSKVPKGTLMIVDGQEAGIVDDGEFELLMEHPGTYQIKAVNPPYFDWIHDEIFSE